MIVERKRFSATKRREKARSEIKKLFVPFRVFSRLNFLFSATILSFLVWSSPEFANAQTKKTIRRKTPAAKKQTSANLPKVTQIDAERLKNLLKPNGKPRLINFWATWCDPCREEFPDLVKIADDYKNKIDVLTVSLDDLAEIKTGVPKFLAQMRSESPAYLLKVPDEGAAIAVVSKDWQGGLPFTILLDASGATIYSKQGKFKTDLLRAEINKATGAETGIAAADEDEAADDEPTAAPPPAVAINTASYKKGIAVARRDVAKGRFAVKRYGLTDGFSFADLDDLKRRYNIEIHEYGCVVTAKTVEYIRGYNAVSSRAIRKKFGDQVADRVYEE